MFPFDPPENIRKSLVFWCFQGEQKGTLGSKGLNPKPVSTEQVLDLLKILMAWIVKIP